MKSASGMVGECRWVWSSGSSKSYGGVGGMSLGVVLWILQVGCRSAEERLPPVVPGSGKVRQTRTASSRRGFLFPFPPAPEKNPARSGTRFLYLPLNNNSFLLVWF